MYFQKYAKYTNIQLLLVFHLLHLRKRLYFLRKAHMAEFWNRMRDIFDT